MHSCPFFRVPQDIVATGGKCYLHKWVTGKGDLSVSILDLLSDWLIISCQCLLLNRGNGEETERSRERAYY